MKGIELCRNFYEQIVRDIVAPIFPSHAAGLIGSGSEVMGFDTELSHDHDWYARCHIFADGSDEKTRREIEAALAEKLPATFEGFEARVGVFTAREFFRTKLGYDAHGMTDFDWLTTPTQSLRELTAGAVFRENGELSWLREKLRFYPDDLLLYILAAQWERIGQEMAFMGRCGDVGDDIGSALVCSRLFTFIMRLCFLYEREYAPYWKWFGTAFGKLACAKRMAPVIGAGLRATDWREREKQLCRAYEILGEVHNAASLTAPIEPGAVQYYDRPYFVANAQAYQRALRGEIGDKRIAALDGEIGAVDQITDQTDFLVRNKMRLCIPQAWEI